MKTKFYRSIILSFLICLLITPALVKGQGCVAVKNMSSCSLSADSLTTSGWQFSLNYRFFRSFRHFKGKEEQKERLEKNTEVINNDNSVIFGIDYKINNKWNVAASIPYIFIDRSSLYEHDRVNRHHSGSKGIGDIRVTGYYNLMRGLTLGLGVKLPTGNYNYKDYFYTVEGPQLRPVDQSIQPGDGGLGVLIELNAFRSIAHNTSLYLNTMYMSNPRNTNGTRTFRETLNPVLANESIMSVVDQYFARLGVQYVVGHRFAIGAGGRVEGIPVEDLIGDSDGFRRPGYIISVEPNAGLTLKSHSINVNVPIAIVRNRTQSLTDKETSRHGDAAFADWLLSVSYAYKLSR